jgi:hypothetical protein
MSLCEGRHHGIVVDRSNLGLGGGLRIASFRQLAFGFLHRGGVFFIGAFFGGNGLSGESLEGGGSLGDRLLQTRSLGSLIVIIDQIVDQAVESREFRDRLFGVRGFVDEVFVAVDHHAELSAPVAQMIIADHGVAAKSQESAEGVADDGRANVAHMHGLGDIGRREIDDIGARLSRAGDSQKRVAQRLRGGSFEHGVQQLEIDEARARDFGRMAEIVEPSLGDQLRGHFARGLAELLGERHGAVGLVVAELSILRGADHVEQGGSVGCPIRQSVAESRSQFTQNIHSVLRLSRLDRGSVWAGERSSGAPLSPRNSQARDIAPRLAKSLVILLPSGRDLTEQVSELL